MKNKHCKEGSLMSIGERIKQAREYAGYTQQELGSLVGITGSALTNYEKGLSTPRYSILIKIMDVLNIDANFLFQDFITNNLSKNKLVDAQDFKQQFCSKLKEARKEKGYSQEQLANKLGLVKSTITGYEKGKSEPSISTIYKIMDILNVDANFLFSIDTDEKVTKDTNNNIIEHYNDLNLIDKGLVNLLINRLMEDYQ